MPTLRPSDRDDEDHTEQRLRDLFRVAAGTPLPDPPVDDDTLSETIRKKTTDPDLAD